MVLLLGALLASRAANGQDWRAAYQRLPAIRNIPCCLVEADTTTSLAQALKQRVYPGVKRIITARRGWFADEDSVSLRHYRLYRVDWPPCGHELLVLEGIMDGFLLTVTPDFQVVDAWQVHNWEPVGWVVSRQQYQQGPKAFAKVKGHASALTGYIMGCASFYTTLTSREFYYNNRNPTVLSQQRTQYSISPAGRIKAIAAKK
ncbi:hypothetical protein [Hymenobacter ruricola]|uniref:hypothetical protein n=1 Tax=Hymenobacter ruricola TaxID=2791023 RepID=UPI0018AFEB7B|nr:hypothetical protein [Hymenobacter ruricola]